MNSERLVGRHAATQVSPNSVQSNVTEETEEHAGHRALVIKAGPVESQGDWYKKACRQA
jgi:hypothetical protein